MNRQYSAATGGFQIFSKLRGFWSRITPAEKMMGILSSLLACIVSIMTLAGQPDGVRQPPPPTTPTIVISKEEVGNDDRYNIRFIEASAEFATKVETYLHDVRELYNTRSCKIYERLSLKRMILSDLAHLNSASCNAVSALDLLASSFIVSSENASNFKKKIKTITKCCQVGPPSLVPLIEAELDTVYHPARNMLVKSIRSTLTDRRKTEMARKDSLVATIFQEPKDDGALLCRLNCSDLDSVKLPLYQPLGTPVVGKQYQPAQGSNPIKAQKKKLRGVNLIIGVCP